MIALTATGFLGAAIAAAVGFLCLVAALPLLGATEARPPLSQPGRTRAETRDRHVGTPQDPDDGPTGCADCYRVGGRCDFHLGWSAAQHRYREIRPPGIPEGR